MNTADIMVMVSSRARHGLTTDVDQPRSGHGHVVCVDMQWWRSRPRAGYGNGLTTDAAADCPWTEHGQVSTTDIVAADGPDTSSQTATDSRT